MLCQEYDSRHSIFYMRKMCNALTFVALAYSPAHNSAPYRLPTSSLLNVFCPFT